MQDKRLQLVADSLRKVLTTLLDDGKGCSESMWTGTVKDVRNGTTGQDRKVGFDCVYSPPTERMRALSQWVGLQVCRGAVAMQPLAWAG